ncbi:MAG: hypothetical protein II992_08280 [Lachnospiraceae bacterium]|nr:hypothetical protein [Lachnospiraceae bacterium]
MKQLGFGKLHMKRRFVALFMVLACVLTMIPQGSMKVSAATNNSTGSVATTDGNTLTLYYNTEWTNAYVHYKVGNGNWTAVPGVAMESTNEQAGYKYKKVIDLGTATTATVCFNNGSGSWDSKNGTNYTIAAGSYGVKDGNVYKITPSTTPTPTPLPELVPTISSDKGSTVTVGTPVTFTGSVNDKSIYHYKNGFSMSIYDADGNSIMHHSLYHSYSQTMTWTPDKVGTYTITYNVSIYQTTVKKASMTLNVISNNNFKASVKLSGPKGNVSAKITTENGTAPYTYEYSYTRDGADKKTGKTTTSLNIISLTSYLGGTYEFTVKVTDAKGQTATASDTLKIESLKLTLDSNATSIVKPGTELKFNASLENEYYYKFPNYMTFSVYKDGSCVGGDYSTGRSFTYTPKEEGKYKVYCEYTDSARETASDTFEFEVRDSSNNTATIYYYNDSWTNANLHFKLSNGNWTAGNGVAMQATTEKSGYTWKYVVDLGTADSVTFCFNNNNGSWDSKNARNYNVKAGVYGVKDEQVKELDDKFTATVKLRGPKGNVCAEINTENGTAPYTYEYSYTRNGADKKTGSSTSGINVISLSSYFGGTYEFTLKVTDANGQVATATDTMVVEPLKVSIVTDTPSVVKVGTALSFDTKIENEYYYKFPKYGKFTLTKSGVGVVTTSTGYSFDYTPTEAGKYVLEYEFTDAAPETATTTFEFEVRESANVMTVYYKNNSWSNAYIHYKVGNGNWTAVPGVKMTASDKAGYTWMYTIEVEDGASVTACFNNGNGSWDSKNGANYYLTGTAVGVKDGSIVTIQ